MSISPRPDSVMDGQPDHGRRLRDRMAEQARMEEVSRILSAIEQGDAQAAEQLLPLVYEELRLLASQRLAREGPAHTLQATALVHEAYLRLVGDQGLHWDSRGHFFAAAARAMRRILIDRARSRNREKRGGDLRRVDLNTAELSVDAVPQEIIDLDEALKQLAAEDKTKADLVELRFFAGMTLREAAEFLGISIATADRYWAYSRAWLFHALRPNESDTVP